MSSEKSANAKKLSGNEAYTMLSEASEGEKGFNLFLGDLTGLDIDDLRKLRAGLDYFVLIRQQTMSSARIRRAINEMLGKRVFYPEIERLRDTFEILRQQIDELISKKTPNEKDEASPENSKILSIFNAARSNGTFGDSLEGLVPEELKELKVLMDTRRKEEEAEVSKGFGFRISKGLFGKFPSSAAQIGEIYKNLYEELSTAGGLIESANRTASIEYFKGFYEYVMGLDPKERTHNLNEWTLENLVDIGEKQIPPGENSGKIMISINSSLEDNLEFVKEHIFEAMSIYNEKRSGLS